MDKLFLIGYVVATFLILLTMALISFREKFKKMYYVTIKPEKTIKVVMHYPNNRFRVFWRVIPLRKRLNIQKSVYLFDEDFLQKTDVYAIQNKKGEPVFSIDEKNYKIDNSDLHKKKNDPFPEIHYFYNVPNPVKFNASTKKVGITSDELQTMQENDLFYKLLSLADQNRMMLFILVAVAFNILLTAVLLAKVFDVIKVS